MHKRSVFTFLLGLVLKCSLQSNANGRIFNLLLGLYKLNPLKGSPVYQSFSNNLLVGMGKGNKDSVAWNYKPSESVKEVQMHLNEIEKIIHSKNKEPVKYVEGPIYDLDDVGVESFITDFVVDNKILSNQDMKSKIENNFMKEDFSSLFEHIGGNENNNEMGVTKLLPINLVNNDTFIRNLPLDNQNEEELEMLDGKDKSGSHVEPLIKVRDKTPEESRMDNIIDGVVEVIAI